jgi:hypothetical protein
MGCGLDGYEQSGSMEQENMKNVSWTCGSARDMENKNRSGVEGAIYIKKKSLE